MRSVLTRILLPLDGSSAAEAQLGRLRPLLKGIETDVVVVRAVEPMLPVDPGVVPLPKLLDEAQGYVAGVVRRLKGEGVKARGLARVGHAATVILDAAGQEGATLVAMGTHGRTGLSRWVIGSVAEKVVRASPIPVLLMRGTGEATFRRILVPIDAGEVSSSVIPKAAEVAKVFESRVWILHILEEQVVEPVPEMKRAADRFLELGIRVEPLLARGEAAGAILEEGRRQSVDLIAMATHGRWGPSRWVLGSVAEKVLRASEVPLLLVRG